MMLNRRQFVTNIGLTIASFATQQRDAREIDASSLGAIGDGVALDTVAIQAALDTAAPGSRVVLRGGGRRYRVGSLFLRSGVDLHLADDAVLLASTDPKDYPAIDGVAILMADGAQGARVSGTGHIDGQALQFMTSYSPVDERWEPKKFRPRMFSLKRCHDIEITGISFGHAPQWGLHLLGCDHVLIDGIRIRNLLDVPNCDGIDPDHCRDVEIRNCDIIGADDGVVIKTSDQSEDFGPSNGLVVKDCTIVTRDSGIKIGTETFSDISRVRFERCKILTGGRGPTITHRHGGTIEDIEFRDIEIVAQHHAARWWGWGEAVSATAWPRVANAKIGRLRNIRLINVKGQAENSVRIDGLPGSPVEDVLLDTVDMTIDKWSPYPGERFDNRPVSASMQGLEPHRTPVFFLRNVRNATLRDCRARWGKNLQDSFSYALETENVEHLKMIGFQGQAAHPKQDKAILFH